VPAIAELDMDGKTLTDECEIAALEIIKEGSFINEPPNEPFYRFKSIKRVVLDDIIYGRGHPDSSEFDLYEAILFQEYDGDTPTGHDQKFYAVVEISKDCK
jgi:hypothetical protein